MISSRRLGSTSFDAANALAMLVLVFVTLYPLYYVLIVSLSRGIAVQRGEVTFWPVDFSLEAYRLVFSDPAILRSYANTILYTTVGTLTNLGFTILCAYPLSRRKFYGRGLFTILIVITMFFQGGLIPLYLTVLNVGMINTMWALILPTAINAWNMIIMRTFFQGIPGELFESAHMDGAGEFRVLLRIVLPLSVPIIATMTLFYAVAHWNSWFPAVIYLNSKAKFPVQVILRNIVIANTLTDQTVEYQGSALDVIATNVKYAVIIVVVTPILLLYPFLQRYFVKGIMIGSLKG